MLQPKKVGSYTIFLYFNLFFFLCVCVDMCPHEECCHDDELRLECFIEGIVFINLEIAFFGINPFLNGILSVLSQVVVRLSTIVFRPLSKNKVWDTKNWYKNWIKGMNNLIGKSRERECWDLTNFFFFKLSFASKLQKAWCQWSLNSNPLGTF